MESSSTKTARRKRFSIAEALGVVTLVSFLGWFLLWPAFQNARDSFSVRSWPTTQAKVTVSKHTKHTNGGGRTSSSHRFRYEYQVDQKTHTGWRYSLGAPSGRQSQGVKLHKSGTILQIHYHPTHHTRSVVNAEPSAWWNFAVLGVSFFLAVVACLVLSNRTGSTRATKPRVEQR